MLQRFTTPNKVDEPVWHALELPAIISELRTSPAGLSSAEAARRLEEQGPNVLKEANPVRPWTILAAQFKSLIVWILIVACFVSGMLGEWIDSIAILAIVVLNACIGFYQEYNAEKSMAALRKMTAPQAKVRRGSDVLVVPASRVVPGDVLELEGGDLVAADARIIDAAALKCIESALTGESVAVEKEPATLEGTGIPLGDRRNMLFMGTTVAAGAAKAVVVATGMQTEIGRIAGLLGQATEEEAAEGTPLQRKLGAFGRVLVWVSLAIVAVLFGLGWVRETKFLELFMTSVSLAVAAVPEGLPAVVTVALALGVRRMARRNSLVRKLPAVETLGSTNVICTDKTGTLTVGEMTARACYVAGQRFEITGEGYKPEGKILMEGREAGVEQAAPLRRLAEVLVGCNNAHLVQEDGEWKGVGDPTEAALLSAGRKAGADMARMDAESPRQHELPFDSERKRHTVIRRSPDGGLTALVNGAPDKLLELCTHILDTDRARPMTQEDREAIAAENAALARQALRVLGSARRDLSNADPHELTAEVVERELTFVGLTGMYDPPRPEVKDAIARCRDAGIRVVMITGDHPHTALAIAHALGIAGSDDIAVSGVELDAMSDEELTARAPKAAVYARVTAGHKLRIIRAHKANDAVVAMTGDGVNDAPAIKGADIGIAMGRTGTEVTKQASDMVITDDNFATIVAAIEQGRGIYANIRKTLLYLLAGNTGELVLMTACVVAGLPAPLLPIHLLWINLVTDGLPALCLATDPIDPDVMKQRPRKRQEPITDRLFLGTMLFTGLLDASVALFVYLQALKVESLEMARTHAFAALVFIELFRSFGARSETKPVWRMSLLGNVHLLVVVGISFTIQIWSHHNELLAKWLRTTLIPLSDCIALVGICTIPLIGIELLKVWRNRRARSPDQGRSFRVDVH